MNWYDNLHAVNLKNGNWSWVEHPQSLTKFLHKQAGPEELVIQLLSQHWREALPNERTRLSLDSQQQILERKILMTVLNKPWMFARTYFSAEASEYLGQNLSKLASNSLGELIFKSYPSISRGPFQFSYLENTSSMYKSMLDLLQQYNSSLATDLIKDTDNYILHKKFIMRRSLFSMGENIPLFNIDEVFMPSLVNKMLNLETSFV